MLMARLECIDGEYILRVSKQDVFHYDLHEGQLLAVVVAPLDTLAMIGAEESERPAESWKLNESGQRYDGANDADTPDKTELFM